jgi:hypothetical protein
MSWQRFAYKPVFAHSNKILLHDIGTYLERCYLGHTPTLNRIPFISIRTIPADPEAMHYELSSMEKTAKNVGVNFYQSFWVKDVERLTKCIENPVIMSRTWIQPRAYDSLYWLTLFQIYDENYDRGTMTDAAVSRWYPKEDLASETLY